MRCLRTAALAITAFMAIAAHSPATPISGTVQTLDGRNFVRLEQWRGEPTLVLFWDISCPPCRVELQSLGRITALLPGWKVHTVALSERRRSAAILREMPSANALHFAALDGAGTGLLARLGNRDGALPYAAALDLHGGLCAVHRGLLDAQAFADIRRQCG